MTRNLLILTPEFNNSHQTTLSHASEEAEDMKRALIPLGYKWKILDSKITFDDLQTSLYNLLNASSSNDYLILYISSHGSHSSSTMFMAHQTEDTKIEMFMENGYFNASGLQSGLNEKFGMVSQVNCGKLCIIYDVCQAGIKDIINAPKVPCSFLRIAACSYKQISRQRVFTERFLNYVSNHGDWGNDYEEEKKLQKLFETKLNQTPEVLSMSTSSRNFYLMKEFFEVPKTERPKTERPKTEGDKTKTEHDISNYFLLALFVLAVSGLCFLMLRKK